jgi:hypothetical protein
MLATLAGRARSVATSACPEQQEQQGGDYDSGGRAHGATLVSDAPRVNRAASIVGHRFPIRERKHRRSLAILSVPSMPPKAPAAIESEKLRAGIPPA